MFLLKKLKLGQKILASFGTITLIFVIMLVVILIGVQRVGFLFNDVETLSNQVDALGRIQSNFLMCRVAVKTLVLNEDNLQKSVYEERFLNITKLIDEYKSYENETTHDNYINEIQSLLKQYDYEYNKLIEIGKVNTDKEGTQLNTYLQNMDAIGPNLSDLIEKVKLEHLDNKNVLEKKYFYYLNLTNIIVLISMIFGIVLVVFLSMALTKFILRPILTLSDTFKKISEDNADMTVRLNTSSNDEIGKMSGYFNVFMQKLESIFNDIEKTNDMRTRQSEVDKIVLGEINLLLLSDKLIKYICNLLNACIGVIYVKKENDEFSLYGSYAKNLEDMNQNSTITVLDGIAGQAVLDKEIKIINDLPQNYFKIKTSLGESVPNSLIVFPCYILDDVVCVIEIGSFDNFSEKEIEILNSIKDSIAVGINRAISRAKINDLYEHTLQQSEELQVQQEELMQSHEELTEQTNALIEKENQLQVQQEELRVTNSELEQRNKDLEIQQNEIIGKNNDLEKAKYDLTEKAKALQLSNKYKSEFLANVSHELKTPLNSILVLSELLSNKMDNTPLSQKELEYAKTIHSSGSELLSLITDILDLAKVEAGKIDIYKENVVFSELSTYFVNSFEQIAHNKNIEFNVKCETNAEFIFTDEQRLKQILKNLLSNAFKFTEKGSIELKIKELSQNGESKYIFEVKDSGIGIEKDKQDIIFEAFKQANGTINRKYGGTGLGLSISKQLSQLLGGDLTVESEPGEGSLFTLLLPKDTNAINEIIEEKKEILQKEIINTSKTEVKEEESSEKTVLIIEDDEIFSNVLKENALKKGLNVFVAFDGKEGLSVAKEKLPDAIILDIGLPDMSGVEVLEKLEDNEITKNIPVHIMSGYDRNDIVTDKSIFGFIKKPVTLKQIEKVFSELNNIKTKSIKNVLMIGISDKEIEEALKNKLEITFKYISLGSDAYSLITQESFDCIIMDKHLDDMSSTDFLDKLYKDGKLNMPVIVYTDKQVTVKEEEELSKYSNSIIIRGTKSLERLVSETEIFMYNLNENTVNRNSFGKANKLIEEDKLSGKKVLIVDDDVRNIFSITGILESKGIEVLVARNGKEGIEKFFNNANVIDLILMDIMMPVIDGYETIREIRKSGKGVNIPIIAITAKSMAEDRAKCIEAGAYDYITKPVDVEKLISLLRVWLYKC